VVRRRGALRDMVHQLLRRGADPNTASVPLPPLLMAAQFGDVDIVKELLLAGANPFVRLPPSVCTPGSNSRDFSITKHAGLGLLNFEYLYPKMFKPL